MMMARVKDRGETGAAAENSRHHSLNSRHDIDCCHSLLGDLSITQRFKDELIKEKSERISRFTYVKI